MAAANNEFFEALSMLEHERVIFIKRANVKQKFGLH